jgi:transcriptional regulator with XRE-family HTH domain
MQDEGFTEQDNTPAILPSRADPPDLLATLRSDPWVGPGPIIRELRRGHGMRLRDLADATGLSIGYLSRVERGETGGDNPSLANLEAIARALEIPLTSLLPPNAASPAPDVDPSEGIIGREVMLALTYHQPTTLPILERLCSRVGPPEAIRTALARLVESGTVRMLPPSAPGRPIWYVVN